MYIVNITLLYMDIRTIMICEYCYSVVSHKGQDTAIAIATEMCRRQLQKQEYRNTDTIRVNSPLELQQYIDFPLHCNYNMHIHTNFVILINTAYAHHIGVLVVNDCSHSERDIASFLVK